MYTLHLVGSRFKVFVKGSQEELLCANVLKYLQGLTEQRLKVLLDCSKITQRPVHCKKVGLSYVMLDQVRLERAPYRFRHRKGSQDRFFSMCLNN